MIGEKQKATCKLFLQVAFFIPKITAMMEYQKILDKIERLIEQLPYRYVKIEVELPRETLVLEKERQNKIGFVSDK